MYAWSFSYRKCVTRTLKRYARCAGLIAGAAMALTAGAADCVPPVSGLVGWWPGDGSATNLLGANNGTLVSGATATNVGMVGQTFRFDGTNNSVSVPDSPTLRPTNLTIEAWVQFSSLNSAGSASAGQQYIVFKQNTSSSVFEGYYLGKERTGSSDHFSFGVSSGTGASANVDSTTLISTGVWYHVAAVRGPNFVQIYVNGQLQGQSTVNFAQNYGNFPLYFGTSGQAFWDRKFAGLLDEVSLYNRALSSNEIAAIYLAGSAGKCKATSGLTITTQPQSQNVVIGSNATFTVAATGTGTLNYQWQFNGNPIGGATGTALNLTGVQPTAAGSYRVVVTNATAALTSSVATLTVLIPPAVTGQPQDVTGIAGSTVGFSATASGTAPLSYRWRQNGTNLNNGGRITGATSDTLTITGLLASDAGSYTLVVSNAAGVATSDPATLTVNGPPLITTQPVGRTVPVGTNVNLFVLATGTQPLSYQWRKNGIDVNGATTFAMSFPSVQTGDAGDYVVVITNVVSAVTSVVATLTVNLPSNCLAAPSGVLGWWPGDGNAMDIVGTNNGVLQGGASAAGTGVVSSAFLMDGTNGYVQVPDAPALRPTNLTVECWVKFNLMDTPGTSTPGAQYLVFKQNTRSSTFEGYNLSKHRYATDIIVWEVSSAAGEAVQINGTTAIQSNVWYHVAGVRGSNYVQLYVNGQLEAQGTVTFPQDYGNFPLYFGSSGQSYWEHKLSGTLDEVSLYNRALSSNEIAAIYLAGATGKCKDSSALSITTQPQSKFVAQNANTTLSVVVAGLAPFSYQWRFGGVPIAGATAANLTLTNAQFTNSGDYTVVITNLSGAVTSAVATVTVMTPPAITTQPQSSTNAPGSTANFTGAANGSAPLNYRWTQNGTPLNNGGRITGATSTTLNITGLLASDAGSYVLWVTNAVGTASSTAATLTINSPPTITQQPANVNALVGSNATFTVAASGAAPLSYQWRKNGTNISGATATALTLVGVQSGDAGNFQVVVANTLGSVTSVVAVLTVNVPSNCLAAPSGVLGWWPGDGNANDIFSSNHGTLQGGATAAGAGRVAQGFTFDGTNNYVSIPDSASLRPTNFTIEAWIKFNGLDTPGSAQAGQQYIIFRQNTRSSLFEGIYLGKERGGSGDFFSCAAYSSTGSGASIDGTTLISTGVWYHVAVVRGPTTMELFVNGQSQGQTTANFAQNYGNYPLYLGTSGQSYWDRKFKGVMDEVTMYNRALSANEISAIFAVGAGGKCKGAAPPSIITQPVNKVYVAGGSTTFSVVSAGTEPLFYQWFRDGFGVVNDGRVSGATSPTLSLTLMQPSDIGNYQVTVSNYLGTAQSAVASLNTGLAPANDNFNSAVSIGGVSGSITGNNANATRQNGEPNHAGNSGPSSVWYNWTAPSTSPVTIDTTLSAFDTLLGVYTGNSVGSLTAIASNNNISTNNSRSRVTFTPVAGTVYHIAVDGANGANGNLTLRWIQASVALPDLVIFGSAVNPFITTQTFGQNSCAVVEGLIAPGVRKVIRFDTQTANQGNADLVFGNPANNPLFVYANCHAHYHFQNYMSYRLRNSSGQIAAVGLKVGFCVLDVFRWSSSGPNKAKYDCNNQGIQQGWGDLYDSSLDGQWIDITGLPDGNYTMEMEANPMGIIQESNYGNNITTVPITIGNSTSPPPNDNLASAQMVLGTSPSVSGTLALATKQAGEPNHAGNAGGHSVWYDWTAPDTKLVTIDTVGSSINTLLGVYTGSTVSALTLVASNDDITPGSVVQSRVSFNAVAGTTYHIAVDGFGGASGPIVLTVNQTVANDAYNACIFTGGVQGSLTGSTVGGTKETGEPNHGGNTGGHSIWYCWTAPVTGTATFDTIGSTFNTLLGVYTGNSVSALTLVAGNDDIGGGTNQSRVSFNAVGLTMYHIVIDGFNGDSGNTRLNWNFSTAAPNSLIANLNNPNAVQTISDSKAILDFKLLAEGMCQISINGTPQMKYRIERSCDLSYWVPLATTVADFEGKAWFTDKAAKHLSGSGDTICGPGKVVGVSVSPTEARFYRAVEVP